MTRIERQALVCAEELAGMDSFFELTRDALTDLLYDAYMAGFSAAEYEI
jgi:hypothetical protein